MRVLGILCCVVLFSSDIAIGTTLAGDKTAVNAVTETVQTPKEAVSQSVPTPKAAESAQAAKETEPAAPTQKATETDVPTSEATEAVVTSKATAPETDPPPVGPIVTDVCGLSLISPGEQSEATHRSCKCSDLDQEVDCSYLDATELPRLISFPKTARFAKFVGNKIENVHNDTFYGGRYVRELDLSHNRIDFVSSGAFRPFRNLRVLDLSHNKIWNLPPKSLEGLADLDFLDLGYNDLVALSPELFAAVPNLGHLDLDSNPLEELEPKQFQHLRRLETLNLESTLLKVIPDHLFLFTPGLRMLELSSNLLTDVPTDALRVLDNLRYLDLSGNPIAVVRERAFLGMRRLVLLYLDRMPMLSAIEKYAFGDLQMLQELHCSYNHLLSDLDERAFVKKTTNEKVQLSQLFLKQDSLTTVPREILDWNDNLELHVSDNPLYCDCHLKWMVDLNLKNEFQKHTKCYGPGHYQDLTISDLKETELSCGLEASEIVIIVLAGGVGFLVLTLVVAFLVWRRNYAGFNRPYFRVSKKRNVEDIDYNRGDDGF